MAAVGALVLVLCLLVSAHCEVRARDPEVEQEEEEEGGRAAEGGGFPPPPKKLQPRVSETPPQSERGDPIVRNGNWCGYIQSKRVMVTEKCGTKKFNIRSQSPCSSGSPDCQIVLYKLATRPLYTQTQKVITSLVWSCCSGHTGDNCELTDKTWLQHHQGDQDPQHIRHHDNQHNPNPTWEPGTTPTPSLRQRKRRRSSCQMTSTPLSSTTHNPLVPCPSPT
ncbi:hypothetical protein INR49_007318 [Caranx melampygus]|nr:hypothetical protein INR49_007318 [Caranx melampygus]